ncbi:hypothetical protein CXB51_035204 [Gossypium anomalum]|uniref:Aminotransferase-like plant mobile domain-containing protein n=1 Tax=Gossypium anomalum TaxID=47600 RepID=A0A8J5Y3K1_9ROSI|nr:hypothetical protein CXB51_035204 [Gossypium anomalum]
MCTYNWDCRWMGLHSPGPFNLLIGEPYATIFWVRFWIIFTEVESRWAGCETHSWSQGMTEVERIRYAGTYILEMIGGYLMPDLSRNLVHLRWNHSASYIGIPITLEDIRLLLDQRQEAHFQWTPYEDPTIRAVIPDEFFQNSNIWHVKVLFVNYATIEMHQTDRVLRQFGFQKLIPVAPEVLDDEHKIDLQQSNTN